jgi:membrane-bound metal-dependent hydrolase YbcI (DUF457 family)
VELARRPTVSRDRRDPPAAIEDSGRPRAQLYFWVLVGITLGILLGYFFPAVAVQLEPLGDSFVNLIKMVIAPVIFCTVVVGLDGTSIYLTLAAIYVAQAQNVRLSIGQQLAAWLGDVAAGAQHDLAVAGAEPDLALGAVMAAPRVSA